MIPQWYILANTMSPLSDISRLDTSVLISHLSLNFNLCKTCTYVYIDVRLFSPHASSCKVTLDNSINKWIFIVIKESAEAKVREDDDNDEAQTYATVNSFCIFC